MLQRLLIPETLCPHKFTTVTDFSFALSLSIPHSRHREGDPPHATKMKHTSVRLSERAISTLYISRELTLAYPLIRFLPEGPSVRRVMVCGRVPQDLPLFEIPQFPTLLQACTVLCQEAKLHPHALQLSVRLLQCHQAQSEEWLRTLLLRSSRPLSQKAGLHQQSPRFLVWGWSCRLVSYKESELQQEFRQVRILLRACTV